jgi:hypothetical protein
MSLLVIFLVKVNLIIQANLSDNGIGEENSDGASNLTVSLKIVVPMWLEHYTSIGKMCLLQ